MKIVLILLALSAGFNNLAFSQTVKEKDREIKFNICVPEITEAGRQSNFHFTYRYRVVTDAGGSVKDINELSNSKNYRSLMNNENIIPCIKGWKLKPSERYFVSISAGTTSAENSFDISNRTTKIKILL